MKHKKKKKNLLPVRYVLLIMTILCGVLIGCNVMFSYTSTVANTAVGYVIIPMQKGINYVGTALTDLRQSLVSKAELQLENETLRMELAEAKEQLNQVQLAREELEGLQKLYDMEQDYATYEKVAAKVIGKDSGNWFSNFVIDKGTRHGITEGMNVIADGGLAGIVTEVGPNYAKVRSIIDDTSNVSSKDLNTSDLCITSGSLKSMNESSLIEFSDLRDKEDQAAIGDQIVTSNISDLYLEGIPIGYITDIKTDANMLTKSGHIATIVDFEHLEHVFVLLQTKESITEHKGE